MKLTKALEIVVRESVMSKAHGFKSYQCWIGLHQFGPIFFSRTEVEMFLGGLI